MSRVLSPQQSDFLAWVRDDNGSAILEAVAGAGKTTTICEAIAEISATGRTVAVMAFNKAMGDELSERVGALPGVFAGTVHSFGFRALARAYGRGIKLDGKKLEKIAAALEVDRPDVADYVTFAAKAASMAKQRLLTPADDDAAWYAMADHFGFAEYLPEEDGERDDSGMMLKGIRVAKAMLKRSLADTKTIDHDDMLYHVVMFNVRMYRNDFVFVDEAQDTNPARRAIALRCLKPGGRLIAVGDPRQAIFGFTGADNDALDQIAAEVGARRMPLTVSFRCPKAVVAHARQWVSHISAADDAPEGRVEYQALDTFQAPEKGVSTAYHWTDLAGNDAILCRLTRPLVALAFNLLRNGVACKIEGRDIGGELVKLAKRWKVARLDTLESRLAQYKARELAKAEKRGDAAAIERITDKVDTLLTIIAGERERGGSTVAGLIATIDGMFANNVSGVVTLATVHRSKGREWQRVFLLSRRTLMPSPMARSAWQEAQEENLIYVAITRAQNTLVELD